MSTTPSKRARPWWRSRALIAIVVAVVVVVLAAVGIAVARSDSPASSNSEFCSATAIAQKVIPSVVTIYANDANGPAGSGSGEFIDKSGHVLTNNHVISAAVDGGSISVLRPNGEESEAQLVGRDPQTDLAVLKIEPDSSVKPVRFATDRRLVAGEQVFAVGAPLGLSDSLTAGIVSSLGRTVRVPSDNNTTALLVSAIQTDAAINPGNSGGTLADCAGELVGVPTAGATASDSQGVPVAGSIGLGFAIPAATARDIADELIANGHVSHAYLGVSVVPVTSGADVSKVAGLFVSKIVGSGPAAEAGLQRGDVITSIAGRSASSADVIQEVTLTKDVGDRVKVEFSRDGKSKSVDVELAAQPTSDGSQPEGSTS